MLRRLVGYASYMFGANAFTALITFAISAAGMVSRSKEAFGDYTLYLAIYSVGQGFFIYGANACIQQWCAADPQNRRRFANLAFRLFGVLILIMGGFGVALGFFVSWIYGLGLIAIPFMVAAWWARYIFRSTLDARKEAVIMMTLSLSNSAGRFFFLTFTDLRDALIYGDFLSVVVGGVTAVLILPRGIGSTFREILSTDVPAQFVRDVLKFARPLWVSGIVFLANGTLETVWTRAALGVAPLGALGAFQQMWQFVAKPIEYISQATLPGLVKAGERREELFCDVLRMCLVTLPMIAIGISIGSPLVFHLIDFISGLFGATSELNVKYAEVPLLMLLASLAIPATNVEMVLNQHSIAEKRPNNVLYAQLFDVLVVAATIYPLATAYGVHGILIASVIGATANMLVYIFLLRRSHPGPVRFALRSSALSFACVVPIAYLGYLFHDEPYSWALAFPAAALYLFGMLLVRLLLPSDIQRVLELLWRPVARADSRQ